MLMAVLLIVGCPAITGFHHLSKGVSQHKPPTLDVKWAANGNMTLQYGNLKVHGGLPSTYDTPAQGTWDSSTTTFTSNAKGAETNWTIRYTTDAAKAELRLQVEARNGPIPRDLTLWPINGKFGSWVYPANLTAPYYTGACSTGPEPRVKMQAYVEAGILTGIVEVLPSNPDNSSFGWFIGHSQLEINGLAPNEVRTVQAALRFGCGPVGEFDPTSLATDAYEAYGTAKPLEFEWLDRRPIGMLFLAGGNAKTAGNINGYNVGLNPPLDFSKPNEIERFRFGLWSTVNRTLSTIESMKPAATPQALIVWDLEGEGDPWATFVGSPDHLPDIAPEFNVLADEFMRNISNNSMFRLGLTLRPQKLVNDTAYKPGHPNSPPYRYIQQELLVDPPRNNATDVPAIAALLVAKMKYAIDRWNVTVFYIDTTGGRNGVYPATVFEAVRAAIGPNILIIPEIPTVDYYRFTTPLHSEIPADVKRIWPLTKTSRDDKSGSAGAFAFNLMQNCCPHWNSSTVDQFSSVVAECSSFMFDGWWASPDKNPVVKYAYGNGSSKCPLNVRSADSRAPSVALLNVANFSVVFDAAQSNGTVAAGLFGISGSNIDMKTLFGNKTDSFDPHVAPGQSWIFNLLSAWRPCAGCPGASIRTNGKSNSIFWGEWWYNHTCHGDHCANFPYFCGGGVPSNGWGNVTVADLAAIKAAVDDLNSTFTFGLNFEPLQYQFKTSCSNASLAVQLAIAALRTRPDLNDRMRFEIGNEYDWGGRRCCTSNTSDLTEQWNIFAEALIQEAGVNPTVLTGLVLAQSSAWYNFIPNFTKQEHGKFGSISGHFYSNVGGRPTTLDAFLSDACALDYVYPHRAAAAAVTRAAGAVWVAREANSLAGGGVAGMSDTFASALWSLDAFYWEAQIGSRAINVNMGAGCATLYDPFCVENIQGPTETGPLKVNPLFYGVTLFSRAVQSNGGTDAIILEPRPVQNTSQAYSRVKIWAVHRAGNEWDGILGKVVAIVAVNKNVSGPDVPVTVQITTFKVSKPFAILERLSAGSQGVQATSKISIAGQTWDGSVDGHLVGQRVSEKVAVSSTGFLSFNLPAASACVVFVPVANP